MTLTRLWRGALWCALGAAASAREFDSIVVTSEMVAMRDGVKLSTDAYRPARGSQAVDQRFPDARRSSYIELPVVK